MYSVLVKLVTSCERLLMGKGVLVIRSHFKTIVFVSTAQPASFSFLLFLCDSLLAKTKMATAIMSGLFGLRLRPDMSARDMVCARGEDQIPGDVVIHDERWCPQPRLPVQPLATNHNI
jgi:hypothetical protein